MDTQLLQIALAAVAVLAVIMLLWRRRAKSLRLRIEPVPPDRIDNSPVERNEIVSAVRVRAREQAVAKSAALTAELTRIEPTVDSSAPNEPGSAELAVPLSEPSPETEDDAFATKAGTPEPVTVEAYCADQSMPNVESASLQRMPTLTQVDLFPDSDVAEATLGGLDDQGLAFERVISIHVMAREEAIAGRLLLEHLLQYGLRYGDMAIFHRHEHPTGQGSVLFSLAQALEPGTFDIDTLARDSVPGVSLFLGLPGYKSVVAFDLMIDTARRLASVLHADMLDDNGQILTAGKLADWRDEVVSYDARAIAR